MPAPVTERERRWALGEQLKTRTRRIRRLSRQWLHNPAGGSRPAFLVGCGRSGTNLITGQLAKSWQVDLFNESNPRAFERWRLRSLDVVAELATASRARVTLFKPILDTHRAGQLLAHFADSKILFVFRHYSDVVNSAQQYFGPARWPGRVRGWLSNDFAEFAAAPVPEATRQAVQALYAGDLPDESLTALYWLLYNRLFFDAGLRQERRVKLVNYEQVVTQPEANFRAICVFLGVSYDRRMARGIYRSSVRHRTPAGVRAEIAGACEQLWDELLAAAGGA